MPWPFFFAAALGAQDPVRPWLDWRTITTATHRLHFPKELEPVARDVASRVEHMDSAIARIVGWRAPKPIDVVIDDPFSLSNGYALPLIDRPVTVWWATPADPRSDIGNFTSWSELLSIHELTHLAHLTRPSRNRRERLLWTVLPARLGPIARRAPRWAYEGYATYVEGRISGTGRPNNSWRPALLRQWAIEGRLPSYWALNGSGEFSGLEFPYLGGSAFLEWLAARAGGAAGGDSSLVDVWRRLSARRVRSFDAAFAGVFGDGPAVLYGRHVAELTRDAMAAKAGLERAGLVEGELVQRLTWYTGDPAISPSGERAVLVLRERDRPSVVVAWSTGPDAADTTAERRRAQEQRRDPEDVPARRVYPPAKRAQQVLWSSNGRSYQMPRWFSDNRRVLLTRWIPRGDGSESSALYVWDTQTGDVRQATDANGFQHADPHPNGTDALAMQCHRGHCDVAHVDLARGAATTLLEGNARTTYYRPRWSPDTMRIAASMQDGKRWRVIVADRDGSAMRTVDPDDGANRYDAQWLNDDTLVVVSERGGIPNLELIAVATGAVKSVTRVTGAAVGPDVNRKDGSIWFLAMHAFGFDVRRITTERADSVVAIDAERFGFAGTRQAKPITLPAAASVEVRKYRTLVARHDRFLPGAFASADGVAALLSAYNGDIVGKHVLSATGAIGQMSAPRGATLRATWRPTRIAIEAGAAAVFEPGKTFRRPLSHSWLALSSATRGDGWRINGRLGGWYRDLGGGGFAETELFTQQVRGARGVTQTTRLSAAYGDADGSFHRLLGTFALATAGRDMPPIQLSATAGLLRGDPHASENFSIGGGRSPLLDSALVRQQHAMPMLPSGVASGRALVAWRGAIPNVFAGLTPFYEGAGVRANLAALPTTWHRAVGVERRFVFGPVPIGFLPRVEIRGGAAYLLDAPVRKTARAYLEMRLEP